MNGWSNLLVELSTAWVILNPSVVCIQSRFCEERKSDCLLYFTYLLSLSENIEIQRRDICFSSFCISELQVIVPVG